MNPTPPTLSSCRAETLWRHLLGLFGADAVKRKFGERPPVEWLAVLERLSQFELERGTRRLVYSGKGYVPTLPEFVSLCRTTGEEERFGGASPSGLPAPDPWQGDGWDIAANKHLLAFIAHAAANGVHYCSAAERRYQKVRRGRDWKPDAETAALTGVLVAYKKAWSQDMREWEGEPDEATQRRTWAECMARAERECQAIRAQYGAGHAA